YQREQASEYVHTVGFWWAVAGLDYYRNYVPNMQKITPADIAKYVRTFMIGKPHVTALLVNPQDRATFKFTPELLMQNGGAK
ncbi:MAG: hypothetical protein ABJC63_10470, partial [Gemmatimonadales bacterium]